jgi:Fe-Mn family superoxide dismutase
MPDAPRPSTSPRLSRRRLIAGGAALTAVAAARTVFAPVVLGEARPIELPPLPYDRTALQPHVSGTTIDFHYGKHHAAYVGMTNELVRGTPLEGLPLEEVVKQSANSPAAARLFDNAAQVWNHTFYWSGMRPKGGGEPTGMVKDRLDAAFGDYAGFRAAFVAAALGQFGSGWAWLVADGDGLRVTKTPNADTPLAHGQRPLLTVDVWEHAYYLDYQNRRADYVAAFLDHLVNWDFVAANL